MAVVGDISQITLPGGNTYDIKDATARAAINGVFVIAWNGTGTATAGNVPAGVTAGSVTGTLAASADTLGKFYLVKSSSQQDPTLLDIYDEYVTVRAGTSPNYTYSWEKIGDTQIKLTAIVTDVTLNKQTTDFVTGYSNTSSANVIGANSTFTVTQPVYSDLAQTYLGATAGKPTVDDAKAVAAVTGYASPSTDTFVKELNVTSSNKLVTTTVKGVSGSTSPTLLNSASVTGEVLTIGSTSVTIPTAASENTTVATGSLASNGGGSAVVTAVSVKTSADALTGLGTPSTSNALGTGATFTAPTVTLATNNSSATGRVQVTTGKTISATTNVGVAWNSKDQKSALTGLGSPSTGKGLNDSTTITVSHPS